MCGGRYDGESSGAAEGGLFEMVSEWKEEKLLDRGYVLEGLYLLRPFFVKFLVLEYYLIDE